MGQVQMEVLGRVIFERFGVRVTFGTGNIVYKETIAKAVEGVGHFEPLRHYAEAHLWMEPAEPGSGISVSSNCSEDVLDLNWQRLITTHILEREHPGVLTGSAITDIKFTIVTGRAHLTEKRLPISPRLLLPLPVISPNRIPGLVKQNPVGQ